MLLKEEIFVIQKNNVVMGNNVFGEKLVTCSNNPITGYYRDGCCNTNKNDLGLHTVCVIITQNFLNFSITVGNDLSTPIKEYDFPGLKEGDKWCLCALRWKQAFKSNCAPKVILEATNEKTLELISLNDLINHAYKK